MRQRDLRTLRQESNRLLWRELYRTADEPDPLGDEAWIDAIDEHESRGNELERLSYAETRGRK